MWPDERLKIQMKEQKISRPLWRLRLRAIQKKSTELTLQIVCSRSIIYILGRHTMFRPDSVSSTIYTDIYIKSKFSTFVYHLHRDFCSQSLWLSY